MKHAVIIVCAIMILAFGLSAIKIDTSVDHEKESEDYTGEVYLLHNNKSYAPFVNFIYTFSADTNLAVDSFRFSASMLNEKKDSGEPSLSDIEEIQISDDVTIVAVLKDAAETKSTLSYQVFDNQGNRVNGTGKVADIEGEPGLYYLVAEKKWMAKDRSYTGLQYIFKVRIE